jgi:hypothetical protein
MPAAVAIPAAISAGTSIVGGIVGSRAAGKAADTQAAAADRVAGMATDATKAAQQGMTTAVGDANGTLLDAYQQQLSNLSPYLQAGGQGLAQLAAGLAPGGSLLKPFDASTVKTDPGFDFRLSEGQKAIERSAAARGGATGGAAGKALTRYAQDYSSNEYNNAYNRAFSTYETDQGNAFNRLAALAGIGQNAVSGANSAAGAWGSGTSANTIGGAQYNGTIGLQGTELAGNAILGGANARASGYMGGANAWSNALSGIGNAAQTAGAQYQDQENQKNLLAALAKMGGK